MLIFLLDIGFLLAFPGFRSSLRCFPTSSKETIACLYGKEKRKRRSLSWRKGGIDFDSSSLFRFSQPCSSFQTSLHPPKNNNQRALAPDAPPDWTLDQIAGLVFGVRQKKKFCDVFLPKRMEERSFFLFRTSPLSPPPPPSTFLPLQKNTKKRLNSWE